MKKYIFGFVLLFINSACVWMRGGDLPYNYFEEVYFLTSNDGIVIVTRSMDSYFSVVKYKLDASPGSDGTNYQVVLVGKYIEDIDGGDVELEFLRDNRLGYHVKVENFDPTCDKLYYYDSGEDSKYLLEHKGRFDPEKDLRKTGSEGSKGQVSTFNIDDWESKGLNRVHR
jgi:hypothetical protein